MLAWIMENKEWLFSGIGVAVSMTIGGWLFSKMSGRDNGNWKGGSSVHQTHTGSGDNVGGKRNTRLRILGSSRLRSTS